MIITEKKMKINKGYLRKKCQIEAICGHGLRRKLFGKVFFSHLKKVAESKASAWSSSLSCHSKQEKRKVITQGN